MKKAMTKLVMVLSIFTFFINWWNMNPKVYKPSPYATERIYLYAK